MIYNVSTSTDLRVRIYLAFYSIVCNCFSALRHLATMSFINCLRLQVNMTGRNRSIRKPWNMGFCMDSLSTPRTSTYIQHPCHSRVRSFGSSTAPWSSISEFIFRKTQRASSQDVWAGQRGVYFGHLRALSAIANWSNCKASEVRRNLRNSTFIAFLVDIPIPSLDVFEEWLHKHSDSSQCHLHRLNWIKRLKMLVGHATTPADVLATKPVVSYSYRHTLTRQNLDQPSLIEKKQTGKTEIKQECLPHISTTSITSTIQVSTLKQIPGAIRELGSNPIRGKISNHLTWYKQLLHRDTMGLRRSESISAKHGLRSWPKAIIRWSSLAQMNGS